MNKHLAKIDYQIVHATPGRIRISFPNLKNDWEWAKKLEQLLNSLDFVIRVRFNPDASSITIRYDASAISDQAVQEHIATTFQQAVLTNIHQHSEKQLKATDTKADSEALASTRSPEELVCNIGGEVVGEIVGSFIGQLLLGSLGACIGSEVMGKAGGLIGESLSKEVADVMGLIKHVEYQATRKMTQSADQVHQP